MGVSLRNIQSFLEDFRCPSHYFFSTISYFKIDNLRDFFSTISYFKISYFKIDNLLRKKNEEREVVRIQIQLTERFGENLFHLKNTMKLRT